jgi:hypothetical protein
MDSTVTGSQIKNVNRHQRIGGFALDRQSTKLWGPRAEVVTGGYCKKYTYVGVQILRLLLLCYFVTKSFLGTLYFLSLSPLVGLTLGLLPVTLSTTTLSVKAYPPRCFEADVHANDLKI